MQTALAAGVPLELHVHPTGGHGFDVGPGDTRSAAILGTALAFLQRELSPDADATHGARVLAPCAVPAPALTGAPPLDFGA